MFLFYLSFLKFSLEVSKFDILHQSPESKKSKRVSLYSISPYTQYPPQSDPQQIKSNKFYKRAIQKATNRSIYYSHSHFLHRHSFSHSQQWTNQAR